MFRFVFIVILTLFFNAHAMSAESVRCTALKTDLSGVYTQGFDYDQTFSIAPSHSWSDIKVVNLNAHQKLEFSINFTYERLLRVEARFSEEIDGASRVLGAGLGTTSPIHILDDSIPAPTRIRAHVNLINNRIINQIETSSLFPGADEVLRSAEESGEELDKNEILKVSLTCEIQ